MKKLIACTVLIGAMAATSLLAIPTSGSVNVSRTDGYYSGSGGEFTITDVDGKFTFQTFCLELSEQVQNNPHTYQLNQFDEATAGGVNNGATVGGGDPISYGTAFLFYEFTKGTLAGYNYTPGAGREATAGQLQNAIWWLEDELTLSAAQIGANPFLGLLNLATAKNDAGGAFGVQVMNLTGANGQPGQDFLAVPDGGLTVALLGMGLAGLGWVNRRIRR
jgi:hypothetical protein